MENDDAIDTVLLGWINTLKILFDKHNTPNPSIGLLTKLAQFFIEQNKKITELSEWKEQAIFIIDKWEKIAEYFDNRIKVGRFKSEECLRIIKEIEEENRKLKEPE